MTDKDLIDMLSTKRICVGFKPDDFGDVDIVYGPDPVTAEAADRIEALTAERDRLRAKLADAAVALDAAGMELSDFANCLSREPWAAGLAYEAAIDARSVMKGEAP